MLKSDTMAIKALSHYGPVTALQFVLGTRYLVVGYGPIARLFNYFTGVEIGSIQVFTKNKIHGAVISGDEKINKDNRRVFFYGGRSVAIIGLAEFAGSDYRTSTNDGQMPGRYERACNDWIISGDFQFQCDDFIYLLTAHNIVIGAQVTSYERGTGASFKVQWTKNCNEKSILYSGSFNVVSDEEVLVFAGTVMSGIYVWKLLLNEASSSGNKFGGEILHHLTGHEGSIFGIKSDRDGTKAVSCSDDRSIKIWDLKTGENIVTGWGHGARIWSLEFFGDVHEDKFSLLSCSEDLTIRIWGFVPGKGRGDNQLVCKKVIEGHSGKNVWSAAIDHQNLVAVSGGNDGKVRLLDLLADEENKYDYTRELSMEVLVKAGSSSVQFAKNETIKSVIYTATTENLLVITSYGKIFHVSENYNKVALIEQVQSFLNEKDAVDDSKDKAQSFTNSFFTVNHIENVVSKNSNNEPFSLVTLTSNTGYQVFVLLDSNLQVVKIADYHAKSLPGVSFKKITNVFTKELSGTRSFFLFESPHPNDPYVFAEFDIENLLYKCHVTLLSKPKTQFVITSFDYSEKHRSLILGSRFATMTIYQLPDVATENETSPVTVEPLQTWKKIFPGDTISQIQVINEFENSAFIVSVALRDGIYSYLKVSLISHNSDENQVGEVVQGLERSSLSGKQHFRVQLDIWQENRISKGGFLEGVIENTSYFQIDSGNDAKVNVRSKDVILYGFKSGYFYLYNETKGYEMWTELCGGSHRLWKFAYGPKTDREQCWEFRFFYVRASTLVVRHKRALFHEKKFQNDLLVEGTHGREIRDMAISPEEKQLGKGSYRLAVTGSEDTGIKFSKLFGTNDGFVRTYWTERLHVSGLQSLKFLATNKFVISSAAREEFYIWKIIDVGSTNNKAQNSEDAVDDSLVYVQCYDKLVPSVSTNPDLRIMDFDFIPVYNEQSQDTEPTGYVLALVYSNSLIKVFHYKIEEKKFSLITTGYYKDICILTCNFIFTNNTDINFGATTPKNSKVYLSISSTDGFITIYELPVIGNSFHVHNNTNGKFLIAADQQPRQESLGTPVLSEQIHQNGIKAMAIMYSSFYKEKEYEVIHIVTGGDDNGLGLFRLHAEPTTGYLIPDSDCLVSFVAGAASSTITSISQLPDKGSSKVLVTSVDQVVKVWDTGLDGLRLVAEKYTTIADTGSSGVTTFNERGRQKTVALIGGIGLSAWGLS